MKTLYSLARLVERDATVADDAGILDWEVPKQKSIVQIGMYFETKLAAFRWLNIVKDDTLFIVETRLYQESDV